VPDLRAKWNIKLAALCKQWVIAAVVWRQTPKPRQNAQPFETISPDPEPQFPAPHPWGEKDQRMRYRQSDQDMLDSIVQPHRC
jgi:hypothetical protein